MEMLRQLWRDDRGLATSLLEVTLVLAITAVISGVAIELTNDQIDAANFQNANGQLKLLGVSVLAFVQDTGQPPAFKQGTSTGPDDAYFTTLQSDGNDPLDLTNTWPKADTRDTFANQLTTNTPGGTGMPYFRKGEIGYARYQGWNGPYLSQIPAADPWGMKYLCNIGLQTPQGARKLGLSTGRRPAVFVISAGPNQVIETKYDQITDEFKSDGDDIVFRIQ